jgi:hypothetical protein
MPRRLNHPGKKYKQKIQPEAKERNYPGKEYYQKIQPDCQGEETIQGISLSRWYSQMSRRKNHSGKEYKQMIQPDAKERKPSKEGVLAGDTAKRSRRETIWDGGRCS